MSATKRNETSKTFDRTGTPAVAVQRMVGLARWVAEMAAGIYKAFRPPKRKRLELRLCTWTKADELLRQNNNWRVAEEDDYNMVLGCVWLEQLEEYPRFDAQPNAPGERLPAKNV